MWPFGHAVAALRRLTDKVAHHAGQAHLGAPKHWLPFFVTREMYQDLDAARASAGLPDLDLEGSLGPTYTEGYPVRRLWPYLVD